MKYFDMAGFVHKNAGRSPKQCAKPGNAQYKYLFGINTIGFPFFGQNIK